MQPILHRGHIAMRRNLYKILLVEDEKADVRWVQELIGEINQDQSDAYHFELQRVAGVEQARDYLATNTADALLLDLSLPGTEGLQALRRLEDIILDIPVLILTSLDDDRTALRSLRRGVQEYLIKGNLTAGLLFRALVHSMERHRLLTLLRNLALVDELTGLYNRRGFMTLAGHELRLAARKNMNAYLIFADMDRLKRINDRHGHREGDQALVMLGEILRRSFRDSDIIGRVGGDEFAILALDARDIDDDELVARLRGNLRDLGGREKMNYSLSLSIGAAKMSPDAPMEIEDLMNEADRRMYRAKQDDR